MIKTKNGYKFKVSDKEMVTYGSDLISVSQDGIIYCGYDQAADYESLTDEEMKELALYMIEKWCKFGNVRYITTF